MAYFQKSGMLSKQRSHGVLLENHDFSCEHFALRLFFGSMVVMQVTFVA
jgi:hypothetical protein